jgi:peptide/nickel transport system ATP-binding protein
MGELPDDLILSVTDLTTHFPTDVGIVRSAQDVSIDLARGETIEFVGESGWGKSVTCFSILGLVTCRDGLYLGGRTSAGNQARWSTFVPWQRARCAG